MLLTGYTVAMETLYAMSITKICSPAIVHLCDTYIVMSLGREWGSLQHDSYTVQRGSFLKSPEKFSVQGSRTKISNLLIPVLFYSHILNMNRCSLHTRRFRGIHSSAFRDRWLKMALLPRNVSKGFGKMGPWSPVSN